VFARIHRKATKLAAAAFLKVLVRTLPHEIHSILTDNGVQFVERCRGVSQSWIGHIFGRPCQFGRICQHNIIEHRLTKSGSRSARIRAAALSYCFSAWVLDAAESSRSEMCRRQGAPVMPAGS